jgi:3-hydroxybutyryl-CoA dehydratase
METGLSVRAQTDQGVSAQRARSHWFEEFEVGRRYPTRRRTITIEDHLSFCRLVGYEVPLFLDARQAETTSFGSVICPSHLIMSFSTAMTGDLFSDSVRGLLAIENAKFLLPVRPGDTIRTEVEVISKRLTSKPGIGLITFRDHVINQEDQTVFQNDKIALIACRPPKSGKADDQ